MPSEDAVVSHSGGPRGRHVPGHAACRRSSLAALAAPGEGTSLARPSAEGLPAACEWGACCSGCRGTRSPLPPSSRPPFSICSASQWLGRSRRRLGSTRCDDSWCPFGTCRSTGDSERLDNQCCKNILGNCDTGNCAVLSLATCHVRGDRPNLRFQFKCQPISGSIWRGASRSLVCD